MGQTIQIDGIKLSHELIQIGIRSTSESECSRFLLYRRLAEQSINVTFLSLENHDRHLASCCCVPITVQDELRNLIASDPDLERRIQIFPSVGMLSLFPHQNNLAVLGRTLQALGKARLPLYGMGSSLSALTVITEYARLGEAAVAIERALKG